MPEEIFISDEPRTRAGHGTGQGGGEEVFISDEEVAAYEKKSDPARRSVVWSVAAVAAAFVLIGGAYAFGKFGGNVGTFTASLLGNSEEETGETFPLWSAGRDPNASFAKADDGGRSDISDRSVGGACGYESGGAPKSGAILFSEIAWMGTEEGAQYEWIELTNIGGMNAEIGGWSVVDKDEQIQFVFPKSVSIASGSYLLLARSADRVGNTKVDYRYTGNLKNEDEGLRLFNTSCEVMDEVMTAPPPAGGWPAGESATKKTMERNLIGRLPDRFAGGWYTSAKVGGTPRTANSPPPAPVSAPAVPSVAPSPTTSPVVADESNTSDRTNTSNQLNTVVISEVMAGKDGAGNWDFVELHNAGTTAVNLTGWSVKKRSSTGTESALVAASRLDGKSIPPGGYLLLAHPDYTGTPSADIVWPKSYTLAYANNAVVLYDADGVKVDEVLWMEIPKGQSYAEVNATWRTSTPTPKTVP